jgi:hypothetical protein
MTTEEFLDSPQYPLGQIPEDWEQLVIVLKEFAKLKCAEQRQICADNATLCWKNESHPKDWPYFAWNPTGTKENGDKATHVDRNTILNAPEPEL